VAINNTARLPQISYRVFDHTTSSGLKFDVIFKFGASVFLYRRRHFRRTTPFSATLVTIISGHAQ